MSTVLFRFLRTLLWVSVSNSFYLDNGRKKNSEIVEFDQTVYSKILSWIESLALIKRVMTDGSIFFFLEKDYELAMKRPKFWQKK